MPATLTFILGFGAVFAGLGSAAGLAGSSLARLTIDLQRLGGLAVPPHASARRICSNATSRRSIFSGIPRVAPFILKSRTMEREGGGFAGDATGRTRLTQ